MDEMKVPTLQEFADELVKEVHSLHERMSSYHLEGRGELAWRSTVLNRLAKVDGIKLPRPWQFED